MGNTKTKVPVCQTCEREREIIIEANKEIERLRDELAGETKGNGKEIDRLRKRTHKMQETADHFRSVCMKQLKIIAKLMGQQ